MARALADIMTELSSVYNPQKTRQQEMYNQGLSALEPQQTADLAGLEAAKKDSFAQIDQGANRRGMYFSGIPLAEQAKYVGQNYLPSVANLQNRYATIKGNLYNTLATALAGIDTEHRKFAQDIYGQEVQADLERERIAAAERAAAASRAASAGSGFSPTFSSNQAVSRPQVLGASATLRDTWQAEANKGDWNAQVALNYAGNDGRYDGLVNSKSEYDILKKMGIQGSYYYPGQGNTLTVGSGGLPIGMPQGTTQIGNGGLPSGLSRAR